MEKKRYDSTVARVAGNLLSGALTAQDFENIGRDKDFVWGDEVAGAVRVARMIVAEIERTEPAPPPVPFVPGNKPPETGPFD